MKCYRIKGWKTQFENNRTRTMDVMRWVPIPNHYDGDGYTELVDGPNGAAIYGAWVAIVGVASRCPERGTLLRSSGEPHTADSIARLTRLPSGIIEKALVKASSKSVGWLELFEAPMVAQDCQAGDTNVTGTCQSVDEEGRKEGIEGKGIEEKEGSADARALLILSFLNDSAGRNFEDCEENLKLIRARLEDCQGDVAGVKQMLTRQCGMWKGDPKMDEFLRPKTLFAKANFRSYYDDRSRPVNGMLFAKPDHRAEKAAREFPEIIKAKEIKL